MSDNVAYSIEIAKKIRQGGAKSWSHNSNRKEIRFYLDGKPVTFENVNWGVAIGVKVALRLMAKAENGNGNG